ncbi:MAG: Fur family transcriptional regulator, partial [Chitinophagaceae bacterium]
MKKTSSEILKSSALSVTEGRKTILDIFLSSVSAMAHQDIESKCKEEYDRVTIYRTLQTFLEKGIIHTIPSSDNITRYALCNDDCIDSGHHHDNHVHFSCNACGKTICLDDTAIPSVHLPKGFRAN